MSDVAEITLTKGCVALVDAADFDWLSQWKWLSNSRYAMRTRKAEDGPGSRLIAMHREILRPAPDRDVDHINGDGLDNRRRNLRQATRAENMRNRRTKGGATGFKGVVYMPHTDMYQARILCDGRLSGSATYATAIAAALAYDAMARELHGEFAAPNFPDLQIPWDWRAALPRRQPRFRALAAELAQAR